MGTEPSVGQQLGQSALRPAGRDPLADVGEVGAGVDAVQATTAPEVPPNTRFAVFDSGAQGTPNAQPVDAVSLLLGVWMSGLKRLSEVGPRLWPAYCVPDSVPKAPTPITLCALACVLTVLAAGPLLPLAAIAAK